MFVPSLQLAYASSLLDVLLMCDCSYPDVTGSSGKALW